MAAQTFCGHDEAVNSATRVGQQHLVSAANDGTLVVWRLATDDHTCRLLETLVCAELPAVFVNCVCWVGGDRIVCGLEDGTMQLWQLQLSGKPSAASERLATLQGHDDSVTCLTAIAATPHTCASGCGDGTVRLWSVTPAGSVTCDATLEGHTDTVWAVCSVDGDCVHAVVSASEDSSMRVWNTITHCCVFILAGHARGVYDVTTIGSTGLVASASADTTLKLWDITAGVCVSTFAGHTDRVVAVAALGTDKLVSGSSDATLRTWDLRTQAVLRTIPLLHARTVWRLIPVDDSHVISTSCVYRSLHYWSLDSLSRRQADSRRAVVLAVFAVLAAGGAAALFAAVRMLRRR